MNSTPWLDEKYAMMLDHYVDRFRVVSRSPLLLNFRCPICGDSQKNKNKARAYVYRNGDGGATFKCHNCGDGRSLKRLLNDVAPELSKEYSLERYSSNADYKFDEKVDRARKVEPIAVKRSVPPNLKRMSDLDKDHPAVAYWKARMIPPSAMHYVHWSDAYFKWVNDEIIPDKFSDRALQHDCGRIVFSMRNRSGEIVGYTGRSIGDESPKYVAIRCASDEDGAAFGMDTVDTSRDVYIVEGPIDSLFLKNSVAMGTSSRSLKFPSSVFVGDNEPRNAEIVGILRKKIDDGDRVVVWPPDMPHKDINDMRMAGLDVQAIISERTFHGISAKIALAEWVKT